MTEEKRRFYNNERKSGLVSALIDAISMVFSSLEAEGYRPYIVQGYRTQAAQDAYYAQGREDLETVNKLRKKANLDPITESENAKRVTWTTHSKHNAGKAIDIVNVKQNGEIDWDDMKFYRVAAEKFANYGITWGGSWKKTPDYPHFEV